MPIDSGNLALKGLDDLFSTEENRQEEQREQVQQMFALVHEMVTTGRVVGDVGKLAVFAGVHKFPARVKCAILAWHAVMAALQGEAQSVTTENDET